MKEKTKTTNLYKSEIHYPNAILQELNKSYEDRQKTVLKTLRSTLTETQNNLLNEFLHLYKKKEQRIVYRNYIEGIKKGLRIGLNCNKIN